MVGFETFGTAFADTEGAVREWHVLLTRSRQEKALAEDLAGLGIGCYLPLMKAIRYYRNRKFAVDIPMFTGYLFLRGSIEDAYRADRTNRVARIIPVCDQARLDGELQSLHIASAKNAKLEVYSYLRKGMRVEVIAGPFKGLQGVVEDRKANRLFLQVELLGMAVAMEIDGSLLEPIE